VQTSAVGDFRLACTGMSLNAEPELIYAARLEHLVEVQALLVFDLGGTRLGRHAAQPPPGGPLRLSCPCARAEDRASERSRLADPRPGPAGRVVFKNCRGSAQRSRSRPCAPVLRRAAGGPILGAMTKKPDRNDRIEHFGEQCASACEPVTAAPTRQLSNSWRSCPRGGYVIQTHVVGAQGRELHLHAEH
jgi:hypothetical protein